MDISDGINDIANRYKFIVDCIYNDVSHDLLCKIINNTDISSMCHEISVLNNVRERDMNDLLDDISNMESTIKDLENVIDNLENNI